MTNPIIWLSTNDNSLERNILDLYPSAILQIGESHLNNPDCLIFSGFTSKEDVERIVNKYEYIPSAIRGPASHSNLGNGYLGTDLTFGICLEIEEVLPFLLITKKEKAKFIREKRKGKKDGIVDRRTKNCCNGFKDTAHNYLEKEVFVDKDFMKILNELVNEEDIVELGCSHRAGLVLELKSLGIKSYTGVDPFNCPDTGSFIKWYREYRGYNPDNDIPISFKKSSGLNYLIDLPENKKVVTISAAVLEYCIIHDESYAKDMILQIERAGVKGLAAAHIVDPFFENIFNESSLIIEASKTLSNGKKFNIYSKS